MERANQDAHIVQQAKQLIVVEQPSGTGELAVSTVMIVLLLGGLSFLLWKRRRTTLAAVVLIAAGLLFAQSKSPQEATRLSLQPVAGTITWQTLRGNRVVTTTTAKASEFRTADLDATAAGGRLVLTRWSGGQEFPLGGAYHPETLAQHAVLDELREMLKQDRDLP